jgi:hypothetical protein
VAIIPPRLAPAPDAIIGQVGADLLPGSGREPIERRDLRSGLGTDGRPVGGALGHLGESGHVDEQSGGGGGRMVIEGGAAAEDGHRAGLGVRPGHELG